jgi:hypothetical protein
MGMHTANINPAEPAILLHPSLLNPGPAPSNTAGGYNISTAELSNPWAAASGQQLFTQMSAYGPSVYASAPTQADLNNDMGMDLMGMELGDWFYENHQMLRLLDDGNLW